MGKLRPKFGVFYRLHISTKLLGNGGFQVNKYSYVATDVNGRTVRGQELAEDYKDLQARLRERKLYVTSYRDLGGGVADVKYKFKTKEVSFISRQLASMTSAGLSLVRALHILQDQQENKKAKAVLLDIYEEVQKGKSFSDVLISKPGVFPDMFVSMVAAGEASGTLDQMLNRLSDHYANANKTANKAKSAMVYCSGRSASCCSGVYVRGDPSDFQGYDESGGHHSHFGGADCVL